MAIHLLGDTGSYVPYPEILRRNERADEIRQAAAPMVRSIVRAEMERQEKRRFTYLWVDERDIDGVAAENVFCDPSGRLVVRVPR